MNCPGCGNENSNDAAFCMRCGKPLQSGSFSAVQRMASGLSEVGKASVAAARELGQTTQKAAQRVGGSLTNSSTPVSIWGPFAGYGQRGRHVAWLLDGAGDQAGQLYNAVKARFERREIPETVTMLKTLQLRGVSADPRPYFVLQRRRATAALYIAQFGQDLYVSQVSYSLGPISMVRVLAFIAMVVYAAFYTPLLTVSMAGAIANGDGGFFAVLLLCCGGPLWIASGFGVLFAVMFAGYRFITDRDILAPFRVTANEFDTDDVIALEKAVEQTVRDSLDKEVGIDRARMPEAISYGLRPQFGS